MMALVSLHLIQPGAASVLARLADTLIGAAIAHLFNYVWPRLGILRGAAHRDACSRPQLAAFAGVAA